MNKFNLLIAGMFSLFLSIGAMAQSKTGIDYFAGKWNVLLKALPQGDTRIVVSIEKKDTTLSGVIQDTTGKEVSKISSIDMKDTVVTVNFSAQGYDVYLVLTRKDDDHVTGRMMDMFDAEGDRVKLVK